MSEATSLRTWELIVSELDACIIRTAADVYRGINDRPDLSLDEALVGVCDCYFSMHTTAHETSLAARQLLVQVTVEIIAGHVVRQSLNALPRPMIVKVDAAGCNTIDRAFSLHVVYLKLAFAAGITGPAMSQMTAICSFYLVMNDLRSRPANRFTVPPELMELYLKILSSLATVPFADLLAAIQHRASEILPPEKCDGRTDRGFPPAWP